MNKAEIWSLFEQIVWFYPSFTGNAEKADAWHELLHDVPFTLAVSNLKRHAKTEKFPPTIAELIGVQNDGSPHVPGIEDTRAYLANMKAREEQVREERARAAGTARIPRSTNSP